MSEDEWLRDRLAEVVPEPPNVPQRAASALGRATRARRRTALLAAAGSVVLVVAGAAVLLPRISGDADGQDPASRDDVPEGAYVDGPVVAQPTGTLEGLDARVGGELQLIGGCLLLGEIPVIWPHGTTWEAEVPAVRLPNGDLVRIGDHVDGGGGYPKVQNLPEPFRGALQDCSTNEHGEVASFNPHGHVQVIVAGRLTIRPWEPANENARPPASLDAVSAQLAELVDFHDDEFSGSWYDHVTGQVFVGVAEDSGITVLAEAGLTDHPRVRIERVRWSLGEAQDILSAYVEKSILNGRFVVMGTAPEGDGFSLWIRGEDLSDAERSDLLTLPGNIEVLTGLTDGFNLN